MCSGLESRAIVQGSLDARAYGRKGCIQHYPVDRKKALEGQGALAQLCLEVTQHPDSATVCPENCDHQGNTAIKVQLDNQECTKMEVRHAYCSLGSLHLEAGDSE